MSSEVYRLRIKSKIQELSKKLHPTFKNFPKYEWQSMVTMIKSEIIEVLSCCESIKYVRSKRLSEAQDIQKSVYRIYSMIEMSHDQKYISTGFFRDVGLMLDVIKGMIYNFISSLVKKP